MLFECVACRLLKSNAAPARRQARWAFQPPPMSPLSASRARRLLKSNGPQSASQARRMIKSTARFEHGIEIPARVGGDVILDGSHAARTAFEDSVCYAYPLLSCGRACLVSPLSGHETQKHAHKAGDCVWRRWGLAGAAAGASNVAELVDPNRTAACALVRPRIGNTRIR